MYRPDEYKRKVLQERDRYLNADHEDTELAFQLHDIQSDCQNVYERIDRIDLGSKNSQF
jgi:hypothetical protein